LNGYPLVKGSRRKFGPEMDHALGYKAQTTMFRADMFSFTSASRTPEGAPSYYLSQRIQITHIFNFCNFFFFLRNLFFQEILTERFEHKILIKYCYDVFLKVFVEVIRDRGQPYNLGGFRGSPPNVGEAHIEHT
jgi:hypothetical protein